MNRLTARRAMLIRTMLCIGVTATTFCSASAEAPKSTSIAGMALGDTPSKIAAYLQTHYPNCDLQQSVYHPLPGEKAGSLAIVAINEGTINICPGTPEGPESIDFLVVRLAHPSIDADRGAFEISLDRHLPDPLVSAKKKLRYPLEKVLAQLRRQYGKPTDERRERVASASANLAKSLGVGGEIKREDYVVRLLWSPKGKLEADWRPEECDCGGNFVTAEIEISRSPLTRPANQFFVVRLVLFARDPVVGQKQAAWNAQWLRREK